MLNLPALNADRLRNEYWEQQLKRFDPALYIRFDETVCKWVIFEYYPENTSPKPLLVLEDENGNPKEFDYKWVVNELDKQHLVWEYKNKVGTNKWFDELEAGADAQRAEMEAKISEENLYMYKHDKLQWRKGKRELMNQPASDVFAGYQFNPSYKGDKNVKREASTKHGKVRGAKGKRIQSNVGESTNPNK